MNRELEDAAGRVVNRGQADDTFGTHPPRFLLDSLG
jgi:hypothetical protein